MSAVSPDPQKLFLPDPDAIPSVLSDKFGPIFVASACCVGVLCQRIAVRRPLYSGAIAGKIAQDQFFKYNAERDALYRNYIALHPEDFPMPERVKVGDVFKKWTPIR